MQYTGRGSAHAAQVVSNLMIPNQVNLEQCKWHDQRTVLLQVLSVYSLHSNHFHLCLSHLCTVCKCRHISSSHHCESPCIQQQTRRRLCGYSTVCWYAQHHTPSICLMLLLLFGLPCLLLSLAAPQPNAAGHQFAWMQMHEQCSMQSLHLPCVVAVLLMPQHRTYISLTRCVTPSCTAAFCLQSWQLLDNTAR